MDRILAKIGLAACMTLAVGTAQAVPVTYVGHLSGLNEATPNASPGTGFAVVTIDTDADLLSVNVTFSGLTSPTTASHIHCCTANPFSFPAVSPATHTPSFDGFPLGVTSGSYDRDFATTDPATWNPDFIAANGGTTDGAETAFAAGLSQGRAYINIHTTEFRAGEILAFLTPIPEPATLALFAAGLLGLGATRRLRSRGT